MSFKLFKKDSFSNDWSFYFDVILHLYIDQANGDHRLMLMYTIGHSTRAIEEFLQILKEYDIKILADIRSWPSSRRNPPFNKDDLDKTLAGAGIKYVWLGKSLGGFRHFGLGADSPNTAWRNEGFRNYADHALTEDFTSGLKELMEFGEYRRTAVMCAEKHYWRCHRRILSDHLATQGVKVMHILDKSEVLEHKLTRFAALKGGILVYPPH